jgi:transcription elongation GreA/GreB family factor
MKKSDEKKILKKIGTYFFHKGWGFGFIKKIRENEIIVDFLRGKKFHKIHSDLFERKCIIISQKHPISLKKTNPSKFSNFLKKNPDDFILKILEGFKNHKASKIEIENQIKFIIGDNWKKWWTRTKNILKKKGKVIIPRKKSGYFILKKNVKDNISEKLYDKTIINNFNKINSFEKQHSFIKKLCSNLKILKKFNSSSFKNFQKIIQTFFKSYKKNYSFQNSNKKYEFLSKKIIGLWIILDFFSVLEKKSILKKININNPPLNSKKIEKKLLNLIENPKENFKICYFLKSKNLKRFFTLIHKKLKQKNKVKFFLKKLKKEEKDSVVRNIILFLIKKRKLKELNIFFKKNINKYNLSSTITCFILKNRNRKNFFNLFDPIININFFQNILHIIDQESLSRSTFSSQTNTLANLLLKDKKLVLDLIKKSTEEDIHEIAQKLIIGHGFDFLTKKSILARLIKKYPSVQKIVIQQNNNNNNFESNKNSLIVSKESFDNLKKEYKTLVEKKIPKNKEAIKIAREHGDLRENSEYKMARQDYETLIARKNKIEKDFTNLQIIDFNKISDQVVGIGCSVLIENHSLKSQKQYSILGAWDSNPEKNIISYKTSIAKVLIGKKVGDKIQLLKSSKNIWKIKKINRYYPKKLKKN